MKFDEFCIFSSDLQRCHTMYEPMNVIKLSIHCYKYNTKPKQKMQKRKQETIHRKCFLTNDKTFSYRAYVLGRYYNGFQSINSHI